MNAASNAPTTRVSFVRVLIVAVATLAAVVGSVLVVRPLVSSAAVVATPQFVPYVDVTATPTYRFETPTTQLGSKVTLAFVVSGHDSACTPSWGGYYTLEQADSTLEVSRRIAQLRSTGGDVRVSFGGAANQELALGCSDPAALAAAYQSVVDHYALTSIDLDIEGAALADKAADARRAAAVRTVQQTTGASGHGLSVWVTLPVGVDGLTADGTAALASLLTAGVELAGVNGMAMDFGTSAGSLGTADAVIAASRSLQAQVRTVFGQAGVPLADDEAWARVGITPMIGQSDVAGETFTIADATKVNAFARSMGVGQVSMWSLNRDATCAYPLPDVVTVVQTSCSGIDQGSATFTATLGLDLSTGSAVPATASPSSSPSSSSTAVAVVDDPAASPFPIWDALTPYAGGTKVVWHHEVYQAGYYTTGIAPDAAVAPNAGTPWILVGPVLPGDKPAPLPSMPTGTYPQWNGSASYPMGSKVLVGTVPYVAKFWSQGQQPGVSVVGGSPWKLVTDAA